MLLENRKGLLGVLGRIRVASLGLRLEETDSLLVVFDHMPDELPVELLTRQLHQLLVHLLRLGRRLLGNLDAIRFRELPRFFERPRMILHELLAVLADLVTLTFLLRKLA